MTSPQSHPRRRNLNGDVPTALRQSLHTRFSAEKSLAESAHSLRKSSTFHSPTTPPAQDDDPILNIPLLPRRSPTCPKALENAVAAGERRVAGLLGAVDRSLSGLDGFSTDSQQTLTPAEDCPVPRFLLDAHFSDSDHMDVDRTQESISVRDTSLEERKHHTSRNHHRSDSGIGSSITDTEDMKMKDNTGTWRCLRTPTSLKANVKAAQIEPTHFSAAEVRFGINGNTTANRDPITGAQHALSEYACRQIQKYIISPIVRESSLKDFHHLVQGIPYRVGRKEITCLRDLEKVLLWLAPVSPSRYVWERRLAHDSVFGVKKWSISKATFLNFCETSIQCIHTTVEYLSDSDQRRPNDRPYTNGYFLDLTEQVRQYAAMITASRERAAAGRGSEEEEAMAFVPCPSMTFTMLTHDYSDERLALHGGLTRNGRPAELVRNKNGRSISLRTGAVVKSESNPMEPSREFKKAVSEEFDDDVLRSMGRRKKGAPPPRDEHQCRDCEKMFKRPCDLTYGSSVIRQRNPLTLPRSKHEKTHSRPWKCSESSCKYHDYGWPTEKERDRHINDKHSSAPSMYKCQFRPCPYESKRESNCKQHMEKAHGWAYVRSKNNGKGGKKSSNGKVPPSPQIKTPGSNVFDASSPEFSSASPYAGRHSMSHSVNGSVAISDESGSLSAVNSPFMDLEHQFGTFNAINWENPTNNDFNTTDPSAYTPNSHRLSWDGEPMSNGSLEPSFETHVPPLEDESLFTQNFDWSNLDTNFTSYNIQLVTPATSIDTRSMDAFSRNPSISLDQPPSSELPSLSPGAQGNVMLYSPFSQNDSSIDEGYGDYASEVGKPSNDFALFDQPNHNVGNAASGNMFQDLSSVVPSAWSGRGTDLAQQLGVNDLMQVDEE